MGNVGLNREVRLVPPRIHDIGHFVEGMCQPGGVILTHGKDDGFADFLTDGVPERILQEGLAEDLVSRIGKESPLELSLFEPTFPISTLQGLPQSATELPDVAE